MFFVSCRGHFGGMLGGAAVAALLGPNYVRGESAAGSWIADRPPLKFLAFPDRPIKIRHKGKDVSRTHTKSGKGESKLNEEDGSRKGKRRSKQGAEAEAGEERS